MSDGRDMAIPPPQSTAELFPDPMDPPKLTPTTIASEATVSHGIFNDSEKDNIRRGIRTAFQSFAGFAASGGITEVYNQWINSGHHLSSFETFVMGLVLTGLAGLFQNMIEDKTGKSILAPTDRKIGDQVLQTGVGSASPTATLSIQPSVKKAA